MRWGYRTEEWAHTLILLLMPRFPTKDAARLREVEAELGCIRESGPSALEWLAPTLRDVLGTEKAFACSYTPRGDGIAIIRGGESGLPRELLAFADRWVMHAPVAWTAYNAMRPQPTQRNVALTLADIYRVAGITTAPVISAVYAHFGIAKHDTLRVLICDGSSLLGYVGLFQANEFEKRQQRMLNHLVPAMRRRLSRERLLGATDPTRQLLDAALAEIPAAAFVMSHAGTVLEANGLAQLRLEGGGLDVRRALRDAILSPSPQASRSFRVTKVGSGAAAPRYLVVEAATAGSLQAVRSAGLRWGFSRPELEVLVALAEGLPTRTIAAQLGLAERTVEGRLTTMFEKAQVETRAELVAKAARG